MWPACPVRFSKKWLNGYHWRELPGVFFFFFFFFCRDRRFVKHVFCRDKSMLVVTKIWSFLFVCFLMFVRQNIFCRDQTLVMTNICRDKYYFCRDKMILAAALSNHKWLPPVAWLQVCRILRRDSNSLPLKFGGYTRNLCVACSC